MSVFCLLLRASGMVFPVNPRIITLVEILIDRHPNAFSVKLLKKFDKKWFLISQFSSY